MREVHRLWIAGHAGFPPHRIGQGFGIQVKNDHVFAAGEEPVGGQMNLLGSRKMYEALVVQRRGPSFPCGLGGGPLLGGAQV